MSLSTITNDLNATLANIVGLPRIINEDENFKPKTNADYPFTRATILPAESRAQDIGTTRQITRGLYRIDFFAARSLQSGININNKAEQVVTAFAPTVKIISDCQLHIEASWIEATRYEGTVIQVPVFVRWSALSL